MVALKFAIGQSEGLSVEECCTQELIDRHLLRSGTNFLMYDTGEESVCIAWVLGNEHSFVSHYVHEEIHRVLHKVVGMDACCDYDKVARHVEGGVAEVPARARPPKIRYFLPYGFPVRFSDES
jgi:hypothetical protein